jgi:BirA family biotin operon repressor/biotin-[acetyl-CoA-carboxylase] ligase
METLIIGKNVISLTDTDSTNNYAMGLLKNVNLPEGTVVHAQRQTAGKGRRGKIWHSGNDLNLIASVVLRPEFLEIKKHFFLYKIAALCCCDILSQIIDESQNDIKIKWPNDILVNGKKICGILIENNIQNEMINWSVIGIGMNINQVDFPGLPLATSVKQITGKETSLHEILSALCMQLEKYYLLLRSGQFTQLRNAYYGKLFAFGQKRLFMRRDRVSRLRICGVDEDGLLMMETADGNIVKADGDIAWIM